MLRFIGILTGVFVAILIFATNCARMGRPEGGPRDSAPPILLKTRPVYGATDFHKKRVRLTFNEYVVLKDQNKQFIMSPPAAKQPTLMIRGKNVIVDFNSPLADSTTYLLNFGNAIVDNNEGNPFENYRFAFSTGNVLDSMRMTGLALDAATGEPLEGAYVCLYDATVDSTASDTVVLRTRPHHIARIDKWGFFIFENIKPIPYKAVVLSDENKNYKYDAGQESIGFFDGTINPAELYPPKQWLQDTAPLVDTGFNREPQFTIRTFTEEVKKHYLMSAQRKESKAFTLIFSAPFPTIDSVEADGVDLSKTIREYSARHDTITYWLRDTAATLPDSLWLNFIYLKTDSLDALSWTRERHKLFFDSKKDAEQKALAKEKEEPKKGGGIGGFLKSIVGIADSDTTYHKPAHWTLKAPLPASITPIQPPTVQFAAPLFALNPQNISIEEVRIHPKTKDTTIVAFRTTLRQDTLCLRHYTMAATWKENTAYRYRILPNTFIDIYGQTNDTIAGSIAVNGEEQTATLAFKCSNVQGTYLLQLMESKGDRVIYEKTVRADGDSVMPAMPYLVPASYRIRVVKDDNDNGKWDSGNYFAHLQPEYAVFLKNADGTTAFTLKANWEQELQVDMDVLFPELRMLTEDAISIDGENNLCYIDN